jgi:hypothetical protein
MGTLTYAACSGDSFTFLCKTLCPPEHGVGISVAYILQFQWLWSNIQNSKIVFTNSISKN